jgi:DNA replication protein DnaC
VLYQRVPRMLEGLGLARGDGRYARMLKSLARVQVLILDDWGLTPLTAEQRRDLLEIIDDRHGRTSTIVTSQLPIENWHTRKRHNAEVSAAVSTGLTNAKEK